MFQISCLKILKTTVLITFHTKTLTIDVMTVGRKLCLRKTALMQAQQTCACMCLASVCQTRRCLLSVCKNHRSACSLRVYTASMKEKKFISFTKTENSACIATNHVELSFKIVTSHITVHLTSQIVWT